MSGRQSVAVAKAIRAVKRGSTLSAAARQCGCHLRSLQRAVKRLRAKEYLACHG